MDIDTANEWAKAMKALAHPTRLQIVNELAKGTKLKDIADILPASQWDISQHLTVLRKANIWIASRTPRRDAITSAVLVL